MLGSRWRVSLARSLPFYYGWVIFAISIWASLSTRPVMALTTLSVFLVPMTEHFGWSRGMFSGAVSLGGIFAVAMSPLVGWWIDRYGSGLVVAAGGAIVGACALGLSLITHTWAFYALYVPGRMSFASPLELGPSTALSNWFIRHRAFVLAMVNVSQGVGLALMAMVAQLLIDGWGWRTAWASIGVFTLAIGVLPALLFMARRPEDMGLAPDSPSRTALGRESLQRSPGSVAETSPPRLEVNFTLREAMRTRSFWILAAFSAAGFMVQGGLGLHQGPHYIEQGMPGPQAALGVSSFALAQVPGGVVWFTLARRLPVRYLMALTGLCLGAGALGTSASASLPGAIASAASLGIGVSGLHVLLQLAWADYYGRYYLGRIRGITLPVQITGQALGPIFAGFMYDARGDYQLPFILLAVGGFMAGLMALSASPPKEPRRSPQ